MSKCVSCGGATDNKIIFGVCRSCQDYILDRRVNEVNEKTAIYYSKEFGAREAKLKAHKQELIDGRKGLQLVKLLREIL